MENAGTRNLLAIPSFSELASDLRKVPDLLNYIRDLVAVQCILFMKSDSRNWSVASHRDTIIPVEGDGSWKSAGEKEGLRYVQPPFEFLRGCVVVRLSLDDVPEGDISVVPGSHDQEGPHDNEMKKTLRVPQGGAIVMRPTLVHASAKLTTSDNRRVLHYLYGPRELPEQYYWRHAA